MELWGHQKEALERARGKRAFALFFEQGCGKTATALHLYRQTEREAGKTHRLLVLCPPIVVQNWKREAEAIFPDLKGQVLCLEGTGQQRYFRLRGSTAHVVITNYETLLMADCLLLLQSMGFDVVVFDESHKLKSLESKRTKMALKLVKGITYRFALSGTPMPNDLMDIFPQMLLLDDGESLGPNQFRFREEYFVNHNWGTRRPFPDWQPRPDAEKRLYRRLEPVAMRVVKSECMTLPPLVRQTIPVLLLPAQRRTYEDMAKHAVAELGDQVVSADLAITKALRLHQIACGFVETDDGEIQRFDPDPRAKALYEVVDNLPRHSKFIVWAVYKENYATIAATLALKGIRSVQLTGETPAGKRDEIVKEFCKGRTQALIAHPQTAGIGVNLVEAEYAIFYSRGFSLENDLQAEARNHRGGSEMHSKITRIDLVATATVDEVILLALQEKQDVQEKVLNYLKGATK